MAGKFNLDKPNPLWKHRPKWANKESEQMIWTLHRIEKQIREEIRREQVTVWSKEEIDRVYNT